jgi:gamma-glutamyl hydrolase
MSMEPSPCMEGVEHALDRTVHAYNNTSSAVHSPLHCTAHSPPTVHKLLTYHLLLLANILGISNASVHRQPLVGIIAQNGTSSISTQYPNPTMTYTYVAGSYADWVGLTGAIPVLLPFDLPRSTLDFILQYLDMFLIPGGATPMGQPGGFSPFQQTVTYVIDYAKKRNDDGIYFPVYGICNGFESMSVYWAQNLNILSCGFNDLMRDHPIVKNETNFQTSSFWTSLNQNNLNYVFDNGFVFYDHNCGISPKSYFANQNLTENTKLLATSFTDAGVEFVTMLEDKKYPFYATQWHPEKNMFERGPAYAFLDKSTPTVQFLSDIIQTLIDKVRQTAKPLSDIPKSIWPYFSIYQTPLMVTYANYERIYLQQRFLSDIHTYSPDPEEQSRPSSEALNPLSQGDQDL